MENATSSLLPRVSAATWASKQQPTVSADTSSEYFPIAPGPSKRRSRRRAALIGFTGHDLEGRDTGKPCIPQIVQRPRPSSQTQESCVVVRELFLKKRQCLDGIPPSTKAPSDLETPSARFSGNASPTSKILHTYSRKVAGSRKAPIVGNDSGSASALVDVAPNIKEDLVVRKLTRIHGKRKRRAPVGELALVRSPAEGDPPMTHLEASCIHIDPRDTSRSP